MHTILAMTIITVFVAALYAAVLAGVDRPDRVDRPAVGLFAALFVRRGRR